MPQGTSKDQLSPELERSRLGIDPGLTNLFFNAEAKPDPNLVWHDEFPLPENDQKDQRKLVKFLTSDKGDALRKGALEVIDKLVKAAEAQGIPKARTRSKVFVDKYRKRPIIPRSNQSLEA